MYKHNLLSLFIFLNFFGIMSGQVDTKSDLFQTLKQKDSLIFHEGFNKCNLLPTENLLTTDLEFYHDKGGFQDKAMFMKAMRENICGSPERKPIRKLTPNTLEVFPLYSKGVLYGALQKGKHEFYIKETDKELYQTGAALFSILWIKENEDWKAKRIYSYHHEAK